MAWTVTGEYRGRPVTVSFRDGQLEGDGALIVEARAMVASGIMVNLPEQGSFAADLDDETKAWVTIESLLFRPRYDGPQLPEIA